jgi:hypothetical protein
LNEGLLYTRPLPPRGRDRPAAVRTAVSSMQSCDCVREPISHVLEYVIRSHWTEVQQARRDMVGLRLVVACAGALGVGAAAVAPLPSHNATTSGKLLFIDYAALAPGFSESLELRVHQPQRALLNGKGGRVLWPQEPWENYAFFSYGSVMTAADGQHRIYYSCDSGASLAPRGGQNRTYHAARAASSKGPRGSHRTPWRPVEDPLDPLQIGNTCYRIRARASARASGSTVRPAAAHRVLTPGKSA